MVLWRQNPQLRTKGFPGKKSIVFSLKIVSLLAAFMEQKDSAESLWYTNIFL